MATIIDGKSLASRVRAEVKREVEEFTQRHGYAPALNVILVGDDPASQLYVRNKKRSCEEVGIQSTIHRLSSSISSEELESLIQELNNDENVHGILLQLPLPEHLDSHKFINMINPLKDVDGFHPENIGLLSIGTPRFVPCTPLGIMRMFEEYKVGVRGKRAVVIGRSIIVGRPMALLLIKHDATVTVCHSKTPNISEIAAEADIVIAAAGRAGLVRGDWVKPGACVIDVGMNRREDGKLTGDVEFEEVKEKASYITPVPGGVGPMTVAMLLKNTLQAAYIQTRA